MTRSDVVADLTVAWVRLFKESGGRAGDEDIDCRDGASKFGERVPLEIEPPRIFRARCADANRLPDGEGFLIGRRERVQSAFGNVTSRGDVREGPCGYSRCRNNDQAPEEPPWRFVQAEPRGATNRPPAVKVSATSTVPAGNRPCWKIESSN